jgi:hypothetical protein
VRSFSQAGSAYHTAKSVPRKPRRSCPLRRLSRDRALARRSGVRLPQMPVAFEFLHSDRGGPVPGASADGRRGSQLARPLGGWQITSIRKPSTPRRGQLAFWASDQGNGCSRSVTASPNGSLKIFHIALRTASAERALDLQRACALLTLQRASIGRASICGLLRRTAPNPLHSHCDCRDVLLLQHRQAAPRGLR